MTGNTRDETEIVFQRLVRLAKETERRQALVLEKMGLSREAFEAMARAGDAIPECERAELQEQLVEALPPPDARIVRAIQPPVEALHGHGLQLLQA